jgi:hypothetical protein
LQQQQRRWWRQRQLQSSSTTDSVKHQAAAAVCYCQQQQQQQQQRVSLLPDSGESPRRGCGPQLVAWCVCDAPVCAGLLQLSATVQLTGVLVTVNHSYPWHRSIHNGWLLNGCLHRLVLLLCTVDVFGMLSVVEGH